MKYKQKKSIGQPEFHLGLVPKSLISTLEKIGSVTLISLTPDPF